ncbi:laminin subunit gamma-1 isoform X1 [Hydra vulgaris]|uniref:laminin subunit gamma-1 isoform X1 n=1 Tax=Hydra vulgaris TaxID=6087 RepID=UPI001F5ECEC6|nr:laminin subunit gamma-1 [Hydra vulgaris]
MMNYFNVFVKFWTLSIAFQNNFFVNGQCVLNAACFPPSIDVAKLIPHNMTINSTCGEVPEDFCVDTDCSLKCDAKDEQTSHPGKYLIDSYDLITYWKSKNFDEPVFIQCDFGYNLMLHQITITFQFELPSSMYIQRSQDTGNSFTTLIYFALRCNDTFNMQESVNYNKLDVICLRIKSEAIQNQISYVPRRDDYVATEVLKNGIVRDYYLATNIRTVLNTFFMPSEFDRSVADPRKFYFAVRDVDIQASCVCNGMSNQCSPEDYGTCICQKNTDGKNCERCRSLFNNKPWTFGQPCESCSCNSHSTSCVYDATKKYGVCQNCMDNTMGDKCDLCAVGYYRNVGKQLFDKNTCISCNCFMSGVLFGSSVCNQVTGRCFCKSNVDGTFCNTCKDGFYGLSATVLNGCNACGCYRFGTINGSAVCDKLTGVCPCKIGFTGRTCADCKPLYFSYPTSNPSECRPCNCDPSGSVNMTCDKSGQCLCRQNYFGSRCEQIRTGFFSASVGQLLFSPQQVSSPVAYFHEYINLTEASGNTFYVLGYSVSIGKLDTSATLVTFQINVPKTMLYEFFIQYKCRDIFSGLSMQVTIESQFFPYSCDDGTMISSSLAMTLSGSLDPDTQTQSFGSLCLSVGTYNVVLWFPPGSAKNGAKVFILGLLLMPFYESQSRYLLLDSDQKTTFKQFYSVASSRVLWATQELVGAKSLAYSYGSIYEQALACGCNSLGSINSYVCNIYGGQCNCKENIYGRTCMSCLPQYYNFSSGLGCVPCNCNEDGSLNQDCDYNTGQCQCNPNVIGRTCNQCALQYFGISTGSGCKPCLCSALYATSSQCDESGQCQCKPGVGSLKCESCAPGFYDLSVSGCKTCLCNPIGTAGNKCNPTTGSCTCKDLVMGVKCDQCTIGYYGFSSDFPNTCLKCYCSGKTSECDAVSDYYLTSASTLFSTTQNNVGLQGWTSVDIYGKDSGKLEWDWAPLYSVDRGFAKLTDTNSDTLFFSAPDIFLGSKRSLYMYYITFDLTQYDDANPMDPTNDGDVIIKGKGLNFKLVMVLPRQPATHPTFTSYKVTFYEVYWRKDNMLGAVPSNIDMIQTISDLEYIYIRGKWTANSDSFVGITNIVMTYSTYKIPKNSGLKVAKNVEYCNCPIAYTGQFCQFCNDGYTRSPPNGNINDVCVPCQCNQHTNKCDPNTGVCFNCQDNTNGTYCEKCAVGFYGDPTKGNSDDCQECACPGGQNAKNQFAKLCLLDNDGKPTCYGCEVGYSGRQCETCSDGYYGNPLDPLGSCKKCICNNNIDEKAAGNCNTTTGVCLRCLKNTIGNNCQYCRPGYYGDALAGTCKDCSCDLVGSFGNDCQNITGYCSCKPNVIGRTCNKCAENTFNFQSNAGCDLCQCDLIGSVSQQCDPNTGVCKCNPRVLGDKCDRCAPGFYDLSKGCLPCDCDADFTMTNTTCDALTGQCMCIVSPLGGKYSGRRCNECAVNAIGTPPECELCHSPCYDNWQKYIDGEVEDINDLNNNVTNLLVRFGSMKYEDISSALSELDINLTYAMNVFTGGIYNTSAKDKQFNQIEMNIINFESVLNLTKQQLYKSKYYFENTVKNFNGAVFLNTPIPQIIPITNITVRLRRQLTNNQKIIDAALITQLAHSFITVTYQQNISGQAVYSLIQNQYRDIVSANESIADAAVRLSSAMADLSQSRMARSQATDFLDTAYKARFTSNSLELMKIHDIIASTLLLQNRTVNVYSSSINTLQTAKNFITRADSESIRMNLMADAASQSVSKLKMDAVTLKANVEGQFSVANNLKESVEDVLYDALQETASLARGVTQLAISRNKTIEARKLSLDIQNYSLPYSLADIQSLSNEIISTVVNEGVINETYNDAQIGLLKAQQVQTRSQEAVDVSQKTLQDIKNLENSLIQSAAVRSSTQESQNRNEQIRFTTLNITSSIESQFSTISGKGAQALSMLNSIISDAENNKMCYVNSKSIIDNATATAASARIIGNDASAVHISNEKSLPSYATQINNLYTTTSATHTEAKKAKDNANLLLNDVTEAERLKNQLLSQESELDLLVAETEAMEATLNNLILKFENERIRLSSCNQP